jgi:DNA polymerase III epsilon subunit-like protein
MTECYISVDIETSGPIVGRHSMVQLGACVVGRETETFTVDLVPISSEFVPAAMQVIGRPLDDFRATGSDPASAMRAFRHWIATASGSARPVFAGFNATFDWAFVNWYLLTFGGDNPFGVGGLDIKSYYMGASACTWDDSRSSRIPASIRGDEEGSHNALRDAIVQAKMFGEMLRLPGRRPIR